MSEVEDDFEVQTSTNRTARRAPNIIKQYDREKSSIGMWKLMRYRTLDTLIGCGVNQTFYANLYIEIAFDERP